MTSRGLILLLTLLAAPVAMAGPDNPFEPPAPHLPRLPIAPLPMSAPPDTHARAQQLSGDAERFRVIAIAGRRAVLALGKEPDKRMFSVTDGGALYVKGHRLKVAIDGLDVQLREGGDVVYEAELDESQDQDHTATTTGSNGAMNNGNGPH